MVSVVEPNVMLLVHITASNGFHFYSRTSYEWPHSNINSRKYFVGETIYPSYSAVWDEWKCTLEV